MPLARWDKTMGVYGLVRGRDRLFAAGAYATLALLYALLFVFAPPPGGGWWRTSVEGVRGVGIVIFLALALLQYAQARVVRLVVSPHGLAYHRAGWALHVAWADIALVADEGLILWPTARRTRAWWGPYVGQWSARSCVVPLALFASRWQASPIGDALRWHAPHLFADDMGRHIRLSTRSALAPPQEERSRVG